MNLIGHRVVFNGINATLNILASRRLSPRQTEAIARMFIRNGNYQKMKAMKKGSCIDLVTTL